MGYGSMSEATHLKIFSKKITNCTCKDKKEATMLILGIDKKRRNWYNYLYIKKQTLRLLSEHSERGKIDMIDVWLIKFACLS